MWAFGVVFYILLGGYPPFFDDDDDELQRKIMFAQFEFHEDYWGDVSEDAKNMIRGLLTTSQSERLTVDQALVHPWMNQRVVDLEAKALHNIDGLRKFQAQKRFRKGVNAVVAAKKFLKIGGFGALLKAAKDQKDAEDAEAGVANLKVSGEESGGGAANP